MQSMRTESLTEMKIDVVNKKILFFNGEISDSAKKYDSDKCKQLSAEPYINVDDTEINKKIYMLENENKELKTQLENLTKCFDKLNSKKSLE